MGTLKTTETKGRRYIHPDDESVAVPSVTTFLNIMDKPALPRWSAKLVAEYAVEHRESWQGLPDDDAVKLLKGIPWSRAKSSADRGTDAHSYAEDRMTLGLPPNAVTNEAKNVDAIIEQLLQRGFKLFDTEVTMWNESAGYAGTCDLIGAMNDEIWLLDWKTSKAVYADMALQLAAYRWCDWYMPNRGNAKVQLRNEDGSPKIQRAAILWVPKEGKGDIVEMKVGADEYDAVLAARKLWQWSNDNK
jgi:hypothetical protein